MAGFAADGQAPASATPLPASPYLIKRWTTENGLPQNSVTSIAQTPDGYLWVGTFGGLARFDGVQFTIFNASNTPALKNDRITALYLGRNGLLWIGDEHGGLSTYQDGRFYFFAQLKPTTTVLQHRPVDAPPVMDIRAIYEDRAGTLWVAAAYAGVHRFVGGKADRLEFFNERHGLPSSRVESIAEDRDGQLWVSTTSGLAVWQEPSTKEVQSSAPAPFKLALTATASERFFKIRAHPDGGLWLLTERNLFRVHEGRRSSYLSHPTKIPATANLIETAKGDWLFSHTASQLFKIGRTPSEAVVRIELEPRQSSYTRSFLEDHEENLWLGTDGEGLLRLRPSRVTMFHPDARQPNVGVGPVLEDHQGNVWMGNNNGLFQRTAEGDIRYFHWGARVNAGDWRINALYEDHTGAVWVGRTKGLARYWAGQFELYPLLDIGMISAITEDRQGQMWLGTWKGLVHFRDGQARLYSAGDGLVGNDVKCLFGGSGGAVWVGTPEGLSRFEKGVFTNYTTREGLSNNYVRDIYEDGEGALWIATYGGGLNRFFNGRFTSITKRQGLFDDFVSRILVDDTDQFWLLSNHGVFQVSRLALKDVAEGRRPTVNCVVYAANDGMVPSEGQGGFQPAGWRARDGQLWFTTIKDYAVVEPRWQTSLPPPVHLERLLLDGVEHDPRLPLEIRPGQGNLEIHYTGLSLGKPEEIRFSYQLLGQQTQWLEVGTRRTAYFQQLQPGSYQFNVKALSPDGVWSAQPASLTIVVKPQFWQMLWFRLLLLASLGGLVLLGYRQRVAWYQRRQARQEAFARELLNSQERERQRIASELHDGLGQSLVIIKQRALQSLTTPDDHETLVEQMQEIVEATTEALSEMREVVFHLRPQQLDRLGLTGALADLLERVSLVNGWQLHERLDEVRGLFLPEAENSIYRIVQECLNNVSKHARATAVTVHLLRHSDWLEVRVQDNGRGFDATVVTLGSGLRSLHERVHLMRGSFHLQSAPGQGTTIQVSLPLPELLLTPSLQQYKNSKIKTDN